MKLRIAAFAVAFGLALALTGCSRPDEQEASPRQPVAARASEAPPTEADRRAARLLSLSNNGALEQIGDAYTLGVACVVSIEALQEMLATSNVLNEDQKKALRTATSIYEKRALAAGDRSAQDIRRDIETQRSASDDVSERARSAVSCLRKLT